MNSEALLMLIAQLYGQLLELEAQNKQLRAIIEAAKNKGE